MPSFVLLLTIAALSASFCHGAVLLSGLNYSPHPPRYDPKGGCEYLGKYYEPGVISEDKDGDCQTVVTCMEGGGVMVGDSVGCMGDVYKGRLAVVSLCVIDAMDVN